MLDFFSKPGRTALAEELYEMNCREELRGYLLVERMRRWLSSARYGQSYVRQRSRNNYLSLIGRTVPCLIPADGFYEWSRTAKGKQPYCFEVNEGELFAFAGLWDRWKNPSGGWTKTCSMLTTNANAVTSTVHDRMPVILDPDGCDLWLDPGMTDMGTASELLKPYDARLMRCYPVSTRINHVASDDEECSRPTEPCQTQNQLFS